MDSIRSCGVDVDARAQSITIVNESGLYSLILTSRKPASPFRASNFASFKIKDLTGEHTSHVMMTKDGFTFLAMGVTTIHTHRSERPVALATFLVKVS